MTCPNCKANNFKREHNSWYCGQCGRHLTRDEVKQLYVEHPSFKFNRKLYCRNYYRKKLRKYREGISIKQIALIKKCHYTTVYRSKHLFDKIDGSGVERFIFNNKVKGWKPDDKSKNQR